MMSERDENEEAGQHLHEHLSGECSRGDEEAATPDILRGESPAEAVTHAASARRESTRLRVGFLSFMYPWGALLQALAIVHFLRRRPETIWMYVILFLGPPGALIYILIEVVPDLGLLRHAYDAFGRRKRISQLEAVVLENPSAGNYEELGDLYLEEEKFARARECYDKAILTPHDPQDPIYRRGVAAIHLNDFAAAVADLEHVTSREPKYDSYRAIALLAHAYANMGRARKPRRCSSRRPRCPRRRKPT